MSALIFVAAIGGFCFGMLTGGVLMRRQSLAAWQDAYSAKCLEIEALRDQVKAFAKLAQINL